MPTRHISRASLAATLVVAFLTLGCNAITAPSSALAGTYTLQTVNGGGLPYVTSVSATDTVQVTAGTIAIQSDSTFVTTLSSRYASPGVVTSSTRTQDGTWSATGTTIAFSYTNGGADAGSVSGNVLTIIATTGSGPLTYVFQK